MKYRICTLIVLAASWLPARAIDNLTTLLPEDVTIFSSSKDSNLFEHLEDHPVRKAIAASELKKIFAPLMAKQAESKEKTDKIFKDETGKSLDEIQKMFSGPSAVGVNIDIAKIFMMGVGGAPAGEPETALKGIAVGDVPQDADLGLLPVLQRQRPSPARSPVTNVVEDRPCRNEQDHGDGAGGEREQRGHPAQQSHDRGGQPHVEEGDEPG